MLSISSEYCFLDGQLVPLSDLKKGDRFKSRSIYEVIRVIDQIPLFFEEHYKRMLESGRIISTAIPYSANDLQLQVKKLAELSNNQEGNVKLIYGFYGKQKSRRLMVSFIPHVYPGIEQYQNGVPVTLYKLERLIPNAKLSKDRPKTLDSLIDHQNGFYEVLMVNSDGNITEGSRSNVFFIKGDTIVTPPNSAVLQGITRTKVIEVIDRKFSLQQKEIDKQELEHFDAVFITGTSPGVLPVKAVDTIQFEVENSILREIMKDYADIVKHYLETACYIQY